MVRNPVVSFGFAELTLEIERQIARSLDLVPVPLDPALASAVGEWKGVSVGIETRAYHGYPVRYARFVVLVSDALEIGNVLCLPELGHPLPILGADLVSLRQETGMVAADLSPVVKPGRRRDAQLAALGARLSSSWPFPAGGTLPEWCSRWFSPYALYTRGNPRHLRGVDDAVYSFARSFVDLARSSRPDADLVREIAAGQEGYLQAHRTEDKGLNLLAKMFGAEWADRYLREVMFPPLTPA